MGGFAVSALVSPMLISKIQDDTIKFVFLAALAAIGAGLLIFLMIFKKKEQNFDTDRV